MQLIHQICTSNREVLTSQNSEIKFLTEILKFRSQFLEYVNPLLEGDEFAS